ncbi:MAG: hypothetical protein NPIRA01_22910 [Nitrospirales bacterium]|nr:MAG: hypothetical protein NPIRA01_22910 [Nitrospirales bacterium]
MKTSYQYLQQYLYLASIVPLIGSLSGCSTVGQCIAWEERPITHSICSTGSTHDGCGVSHTTNTYTTFEKVCTARLSPNTDEAIVKAIEP